MRSDEHDRTTQEHEQPRRRRYDRLTLKRIIELGSAIGLLWAGFSGISAAIGARWATHTEVQAAVRPVVDTLADFRRVTDARLGAIEAQQRDDAATRALLPAYFRLQCIQLEQYRSTSLAEAAGFPCDSLLRRRR